MPTVNDYLKKITPSQKDEFEKIRKIVKAMVPDAEEVISYGIPTFKHKGKYLIYFGAFKNHMSLFPGAPLKLTEKLKEFKLSKGTIQFTEDKPIPEEIIKEMVLTRLKEIEKLA